MPSWEAVFMDWLHLGASSAPCTTTQQAPDPDERAVVMLKSRHLQLVSSLQQELEQLKQANQERASYVKVLERKCAALTRQAEQLQRDHQQQLRDIWDKAKLDQDCALGSLTYRFNTETSRLVACHQAEVQAKEDELQVMTATLRRTEGLLSDGNRPQLAVKVWRSTLEQQEVVLPEHPGGSQAPDQLLQLLQQAERNGHGIAGVCEGRFTAVKVQPRGAPAADDDDAWMLPVAKAQDAAATMPTHSGMAQEQMAPVAVTAAVTSAGAVTTQGVESVPDAGPDPGSAIPFERLMAEEEEEQQQQQQQMQDQLQQPAGCNSTARSPLSPARHTVQLCAAPSSGLPAPPVQASPAAPGCPVKTRQMTAGSPTLALPMAGSPARCLQLRRRLHKVPVFTSDLCTLTDASSLADGNNMQFVKVHVSAMHIPYSPDSPTAAALDSCSSSPRAVVNSSMDASDEEVGLH